MKAEAILQAAVEKKTPSERAAYLDGACGQDAALRALVEGLLKAHEDAGSFLEQPLFEQTPTVDTFPDPEQPGTIIGPYKLLQPIGEGGMGTVFMAQQTEPVKRLVALKVIKLGMDSRQVIARFEAERQALALMDHPNIAKVFDAGATASGRPYFVMELVKGAPIARYCDEHRLTPRERLELFVPVCQAVQHAHQKGIIHRDLKPSNVMVALYDGKPVPKVIDFGVAKATGQPLTESTLVTGLGAIVGTLEYMSPEQAEFNALDIDTRSDIYGLGVLLYELLTGTTPLTKQRLHLAAMAEVLRLIREEEPPKPSTRLAESKDSLPSISAQRHMEPEKLTKLVRGELDWIVMKALEKDRNRRYETANGFALDLQRYLADEPVQACPQSTAYRLRKFARRNKRMLATTALFGVLLLAAVGTVAAILGWASRDREAMRKELAHDEASRQQALAHEITRALDETADAYQHGKLPEALAAMKRADGFVASGSTNEELALRARQWRTDLEFVSRLEEIRLERAAETDDKFDWAWADAAYRKVFRDFGLDVETDLADAAQRIEASAVKDNVVAGLDDWVLTKRLGRLPGLEPLRAILGRADSDPWRNRVREALVSRDAQTLKKLSLDKEVLALPPATVHFLGVVLAETGQRPLAVEVLRQARDRYPGDFWINHDLGAYLYLLNPPQAGRAVASLRTAVALRPESALVFVNLGYALWKNREPAEAEVEFRKALRLKPDYARAHLNLGVVLREQGKFEECEAEYREAVRLKPAYVKARVHLGIALIRRGQLAEAEAEFREALRLEPDQVEAHANLGRALERRGQPAEAEAEYREAIRLKPEIVDARLNLAIALEKRGQLAEAEAIIREAIRLKPDYPRAHLNLGIVLRAQSKLKEGEAEYREAVRLKPDYVDARLNLGRALERRGQLAEAEAEYREVVRLKPDHAEAKKWLANVRSEQIKRSKAREEAEVALARLNAGRDLERRGLLDEARAAFQEAVSRYEPLVAKTPKAPDLSNLGIALDRLSVILRDRGHLVEARQHLDRAIGYLKAALQIAPTNTRYRQLLRDVYWSLAETLVRLKDHGEAAKVAAGLPTALPDDGLWHVRAAGYLACCASLARDDAKLTSEDRTILAHTYADRARQLLGQAIQRMAENSTTQNAASEEFGFFAARLRNTGNASAAKEVYNLGITHLEKLVERFPANERYRHALAGNYHNLGNLLSAVVLHQEAERAFRGACVHWEKLAADFPKQPQYCYQLIWGRNNQAWMLSFSGRPQEAKKVFQQALPVAEKLVADFPSEPDYIHVAAKNLHGIAVTLTQLGELAEAKQFFERAIHRHNAAIRITPKSNYLQDLRDHYWMLAETLVRLKDHGEAAKAAAELPTGSPWHLRAAEILARCVSLAEKDAKFSEAQRQAIAQGYAEQAKRLMQKTGKPKKGNANERLATDDLYLANVSLALGDPASARAATGRAVVLGPDDLHVGFAHASVLMLAGDDKEYRQACGRLWERFGQTKIPRDACLMARICTLAPNGVSDPARLVSVAEGAVSAAPGSDWNLHALGAAHYRARQFDLAIKRLQQSLDLKPDGESSICNWLMLAMAHHQLGHGDEARHWLDKAVRWLDQPFAAAPTESIGPLGRLEREDWLACRVLRCETEMLVNGKPELLPTPKEK